MFEQAELQGTQMGPNARLMQKERLKSPQESLILWRNDFLVLVAELFFLF